jgi:hypothetical protein
MTGLTQHEYDTQTTILEVRGVLAALAGAAYQVVPESVRVRMLKLETVLSETMLVTATSASGVAFHPPCPLARCFPDDPDEITIVLDTLAKGERYHGGGGAFVEFWIDRAKPAVGDADTIDNCSHCGCKPEEVMASCTTGAGEPGKPCDGEAA